MIGSFKKYGKLVKHNEFNYGRQTSNRSYELTLDGIGDVTLDLRTSLVRRDKETEDLYQDIAGIGFIFPGEGDRFMFVIPWEWVDAYAHNDAVGPYYPLEELYNEVMGFLEDYL
ncbi:predicted ORF [Xanthomonas phage XacN1]|nr:predicted ORF [Xanthomonas phage XacN1]